MLLDTDASSFGMYDIGEHEVPGMGVVSVAGHVRTVRRDNREYYGVRKIKAALERRGVTASGRRIGGIMRGWGMTSAYARKRSEPHGTRAWCWPRSPPSTSR